MPPRLSTRRPAGRASSPSATTSTGPSRAPAPVNWMFAFSLDGEFTQAPRARYEALLQTFGGLSAPTEHGGYAALGSPSAARHFAFLARSREVLTEAQLRAALLLDADAGTRCEALRAALAAPSYLQWQQVGMLLSTWPEADDPAAARAEAEAALARWPDRLRTTAGPWLERARAGEPSLYGLVRRACSNDIGADLDAGLLDHVTELGTQDLAGLERHHARLGHLKLLSFTGEADAHEVVARCTGLTGLEALDIAFPSHGHGHGALDVASFVRAPHLAGLRALALTGYALDAAAVRALAEGPQPIERLRLEDARLTGAAAGEALAALAAAKPLRSLEVKHNALGPAGARALFAGSGLGALRALDLGANEVGDEGVAALAGCDALGELRWLDLTSNHGKGQVHAAGAKALAGARALGCLETLVLLGHPIGAEGAAAVLGSHALRALRNVGLYCCNIQARDLLARVDEGPAPLARLDLGSMFYDRRAADWSRAAFLRGVTHLKVDALGGADYEPFLACPHLASVATLILGGCYAAEPRARKALAAASPWPALRWLSMMGWRFDAAQARSFARGALAQGVQGVQVMPSYIDAAAAEAFWDAGVPLVTSYAVDDFPVNTRRHRDQSFRDDV